MMLRIEARISSIEGSWARCARSIASRSRSLEFELTAFIRPPCPIQGASFYAPARGRTQLAPSPTTELSGDILYDNHLRPPPASSGETKGPTVRSAS